MFPAEPIPESIGSYKIVRRLGGVGAAEVYLAKAQGPMGFARECELKLMPDTSDGDASYAEELAREAAICAKLNNPAVVRVFDFFEHHGKLVLALEHVEGNTLAELVAHVAEKHQKLGDAAVFYLGGKIAGALADAHAARDEQGNATPIIHRNLSPETVLVSVDGEVRLTGFGVGKILGRTPDTAIGRVKGTPGYMAPEQARGEPVTPKADVYGLGLLLWSLLAGKRPPTDGTWPRRVSNLRTDLPKEVAAVLDAALDHFPGTRKITAREIEQWLSKAGPAAKGKAELRDAVIALRADTKDAEPPPPSSRRRIAAVGSPYQGVSFGPAPSRDRPAAAKHRSEGPTGKSHAPPSSAPPSPAVRVPNPAGVTVRSRLPTVSGIGATEGAVATKRAGDPVPSSREVPLPPSAPRPAAPLPDSQTLPSRNVVPANTVADVDALSSDDVAPISIDAVAPTARPGPLAAQKLPPARALASESPAAPPALLAPVLPIAPAHLDPPPAPHAPAPLTFGAPPAGTPAPATVVFGAPPVATLTPPPVAFGPPPGATPAPATVAFGAPPIAATPVPASVAFGAPPMAATPAPASVAFGAPPIATPTPGPAAILPVPPPPPYRAPMPSLLTIGPGRRSLSAMGAIVVSAITATVVVAVALYLFVNRDKTPAAGSPSASAPVLASAPPPVPAAPTAKATASAAAGQPGAAELPYGFGYLTVASPADASVYVSGKLAGSVNKPLKVRCGRWFIRLAAPQEGGRYPEWVSAGETVVVPCQENTRLDMTPHGH